MAPGDRIKIAICIFNLNGFIDAEYLEWAKPKCVTINESMNFMTYNREKQLKKLISLRKDHRIAKHLKIICD